MKKIFALFFNLTMGVVLASLVGGGAFAALNAVGGLAALLGADILIVMLRIPVVADPFCIHAGNRTCCFQ